MIAALKRAVAHWSADAQWTRVRPPLVELSPDQSSALIADLEQRGFSMPGLGPGVPA
jgi:4-hydroxy-tetrahydrodipicolinate synthase